MKEIGLKTKLKINQGGFVMKLTGKLWSLSVVVLVCLSLTIGIIGCTKDAPLASSNNSNHNSKEIQLISWNTPTSLFKKIHSSSEWVSQENGGELIIQINDSLTNNILGKAKLTIDSASIDQDKMITMEMDDEVLDFYFGPSGTQFSPEARFSFWMTGLDLSGIDPATINLFYFDHGTGNWEAVPSDYVYVNSWYGYVKITNARLSHFSRYAIGAE